MASHPTADRFASEPRLPGTDVPVVSAGVVIVGTGSAAYACADRLHLLGVDDVVMITDRIGAGTSRNAGSDKQTYYKLTLSGSEADSVRAMAQTLFDGGAMDGDNALVEAALSTRCFMRLCDVGVPFPTDRWGQFTGYKTDHDPRQRATSVGPYTSKSMTEHLEKQVQAAGTRIIDSCRLVDLVTDGDRVVGALFLRKDTFLRKDSPDSARRFLLVRCRHLVAATGGPAGMYRDSVYPHGQWGATGALLRAGAVGKNLTEWQFGLASVAPRWNVSGTYMQAVPAFVSTDADGGDEREFLAEALPDPADLATRVFLKGYQWPFDIRKARDGSSLIDLLVHRETVLSGRRVYLDFTRNPLGRRFDMGELGEEARSYLTDAGLGDSDTRPIDRLRTLNEPAYRFYLDRNPGIDLETQRLEVAVCAQHNNGGIEVDPWWRSSLPGLYSIGETAGSHGVYRPGGAALNSGQVGANRAAQAIAAGPAEPVGSSDFAGPAAAVLKAARAVLDAATTAYSTRVADGSGPADTTDGALRDAGADMSANAGLVRSRENLAQLLGRVRDRQEHFATSVAADPSSRQSVDRAFLLRDILTSQRVYLAAMIDYLDHGGRSRGAVLYTDPDGVLPVDAQGRELALPEGFRHLTDDGALDGQVQQARLPTGGAAPEFTWRPVRPIPADDESFEKVWKEYREQGPVR